jgi:hypothetical protein
MGWHISQERNHETICFFGSRMSTISFFIRMIESSDSIWTMPPFDEMGFFGNSIYRGDGWKWTLAHHLEVEDDLLFRKRITNYFIHEDDWIFGFELNYELQFDEMGFFGNSNCQIVKWRTMTTVSKAKYEEVRFFVFDASYYGSNLRIWCEIWHPNLMKCNSSEFQFVQLMVWKCTMHHFDSNKWETVFFFGSWLPSVSNCTWMTGFSDSVWHVTLHFAEKGFFGNSNRQSVLTKWRQWHHVQRCEICQFTFSEVNWNIFHSHMKVGSSDSMWNMTLYGDLNATEWIIVSQRTRCSIICFLGDKLKDVSIFVVMVESSESIWPMIHQDGLISFGKTNYRGGLKWCGRHLFLGVPNSTPLLR